MSTSMTRRALGIAAALAASSAVASPAHAAGSTILDSLALDTARLVTTDVQTKRVSGKEVTGACGSAVGLARDFESTDYVVQATAMSSSSGAAAAPVGTTVTCALKDRDNLSVTFGTASGGLPGAVAVTVPKTITVPAGRRVRTCVSAWAGFTDGEVVAQSAAC